MTIVAPCAGSVVVVEHGQESKADVDEPASVSEDVADDATPLEDSEVEESVDEPNGEDVVGAEEAGGEDTEAVPEESDEEDKQADATSEEGVEEGKQADTISERSVEKDKQADAATEESVEEDKQTDATTEDSKDASEEEIRGSKGARPLSRSMVEPLLVDNYILVTWANWHYRDFVANWVHHLRATGCTAFIVGAMDTELYDWLVESGIPTFSMASGLPTSDFGWGSSNFFKMGREKVGLVSAFLDMGIDVLISDVDTVWLRDPIPYMQRYHDVDVLSSSDVVSSTSRTEDLEGPKGRHGVANIGIMLFRPKALDFAKEWAAVMDKDPNYWDQNAFNDLLLKDARGVPNRTDNVMTVYGGKLLGGILPVSIFCSGQTYKEGLYTVLGLEPYVMHATFQFSGTVGKRHRMREWSIWKDNAEHWEHSVGFLSYEADVPDYLLEAVRQVEPSYQIETTLPHFALVNHQLAQLRTAFIAAEQLGGAATVLPHMWVGMDRWWAPHNGRLPNSNITLPFAAPSDLVLDLEDLDNQLPNGYREWSFLDKPEAKDLLASALTVQICEKGKDKDCAAGDAAAAPVDGVVRMKPRRSLKQWRVALGEAFKDHRLVSVKGGMERALTLTDAEVKEYNEKMLTWASIYCCVMAPVGHIWYDMFWDIPNHTDRHNRVQGESWMPLLGP